MRTSTSLSVFAAIGNVFATSGSFNILSYNIAGLPSFINNNGIVGHKEANTAAIAQRFNTSDFDIIHVQEDFAYHHQLYSTDTHPHRTITSGNVPFGSGLNTLSNYPWSDFRRITWDACDLNGGDCLTPKGFTFMRVNIDASASIDFYNLHAEAANDPGDLDARKKDIQQLADYIAVHSVGQPVLVFGDTNSLYSRQGDTIRNLLALPTGLKDAWVELYVDGSVPPVHAPECNDATQVLSCETLDKVLYRSGSQVVLQAEEFRYETERFKRPDGKAGLSDHNPVMARFVWSLLRT